MQKQELNIPVGASSNSSETQETKRLAEWAKKASEWVIKLKTTSAQNNDTITVPEKIKMLEIRGRRPDRFVIRKFPAKVVGVQSDNDDGSSRQDVIKTLKEGQRVRLVWNKSNKYDENAIMCFPGANGCGKQQKIDRSQQFGHLKSDLAEDIVGIYRQYKEGSVRVYAEVLKILTPHTDASCYGVILLIYIYDNQFEDVVMTYKFYASPYLWNTLEVLQRHGEIFKGTMLEAPKIGNDQRYGFWETAEDFGPEESRSNIGMVSTPHYIKFLIRFQKIVESGLDYPQKIYSILNLASENTEFKEFIERNIECDKDFPSSFFFSKLTEVYGIGQVTAKSLFNSGIYTLDDLKNASDEAILSVPGVKQGMLKKIRMYFRGQKATT